MHHNSLRLRETASLHPSSHPAGRNSATYTLIISFSSTHLTSLITAPRLRNSLSVTQNSKFYISLMPAKYSSSSYLEASPMAASRSILAFRRSYFRDIKQASTPAAPAYPQDSSIIHSINRAEGGYTIQQTLPCSLFGPATFGY